LVLVLNRMTFSVTSMEMKYSKNVSKEQINKNGSDEFIELYEIINRLFPTKNMITHMNHTR
jgi:hypothetical protein